MQQFWFFYDKIYFINILHNKKTFYIFAIVQSKREISILQYFLASLLLKKLYIKELISSISFK